jgi:hypothetical protein
MISDEMAISQTKKWIIDVVIGCNFCPFAAREVKQQTVFYLVESREGLKLSLEAFIRECHRLDDEAAIETTLIIFPNSFQKFEDYLELVSMAETLLQKEGYEGIYQVASFHPEYLFAGAPADDAANYSNRSIYPMLHLIREESIESALKKYPDPEAIPGRNIDFARNKGLLYMNMLRKSCM